MKWSVPHEWAGETAFLLGGGPSLRGFDATTLAGHGRIIAINRAWELCPCADVLYFSDYSFWQEYGVKVWQRFHGKFVSGAPELTDAAYVQSLNLTGQLGLEMDPTGLRHGSNSGYAAMNLAYHFGVSRIVLLGYDMRTSKGRTHFHEGYGRTEADVANTLQHAMLPCFNSLIIPLAQAGVEVLNGNPDSALGCWPKVELLDVLSSPAVRNPHRSSIAESANAAQ
jgi:hypothetical protein